MATLVVTVNFTEMIKYGFILKPNIAKPVVMCEASPLQGCEKVAYRQQYIAGISVCCVLCWTIGSLCGSAKKWN